MWFLFKGTFWFSLILVALSYFGDKNDSTKEPSTFDMTSTISAAGEAYRYASSICAEKPDVCVQWIETFHALGERAREGVRVAYTLIDAQVAKTETPTAAPAISMNFPKNADMLKTRTVIPLPQQRPAP